ncbi:MAG: T9SS type A sorting domain-containing protein [Taibaiella sp.]|nr:T9SS type A sorting domain-containing protein [Taibaiella sp.]
MRQFYSFVRTSLFVLLAMTGMQKAYAQAPIILTSPANKTVCAGGSTSFSVVAIGLGLSYQWQVDSGTGFNNVSGSVYSGGTGATLSLSPIPYSMNNFMYRCIVTNSSGSATSSTATLTVNTLPQVLLDPTNTAVCTGGNTSFTVVASGTGLTYKWQVSSGGPFVDVVASGIYSGNTTATLSITGATAGLNNNKYQVIVSGTCSPSQTSAAATLTVNAAPAITSNPVNTSVCVNGNTTFSVTATGGGLTYKWQVSTGGPFVDVVASSIYSGVTTSTLIITGAIAAMNGNRYQVIVTGSCSPGTTSTTAALTVNPGPTIITQPASSATICYGGSTSFTVVVSGGTLTYKWQVNSGSGFVDITTAGPYSGGTTATLNISGATLENGYTYRCIITGSCPPPDTTTTSTLIINSPPSITSSPSSTSVCPGNNATFTVSAVGAGLVYQWQADTGTGYFNLTNAAPYSGVTTATLTVSSVTAGMNGWKYRVIVSGTCLPPTPSALATLTVNTLPAVTSSPANQTVCAGATVTFSAAGTGSGITYKWQVNTGSGFTDVVNGGVYSGATTNTLTITGATVAMSGYIYQCIISGACTPAATTASATLTVNAAPTGTTPANVAVCPGGTATFTTTASGVGVTYLWQYNFGFGYFTAAAFTGYTTNTLTVSPVLAGYNGYLFRCIISGTCSPAFTTGAATLTVNTLPAIVASPSNTSACLGSNATFTCTASGTGLTYQWQYNLGGSFINVPTTYPGYNGPTLTVPAVTLALNGIQFRCIVTGTCSPPSATTAAATLTVTTAPANASLPTTNTVCSGSTATFTSAATGSGLTYQWKYFSGGSFVNVPTTAPYFGGTSSTLFVFPVTAAMNNTRFIVVVTGTCSPAATSNEDTLKVNIAPAVTVAPVATAVCAGNNAFFSVTATGTAITYQWQYNLGGIFVNVPVTYPGYNTANLTVPAPTAALNGVQFRVVITGTCTPVYTSPGVVLTVNSAPTITVPVNNVTACQGSNAIFFLTATGAGLTYYWEYYNGTSYVAVPNTYPGYNTRVLTVPAVTVAMNGFIYRVTVSGTCTPSQQSSGTLVVNTLPVITSNAKNATICSGNDTSFTITATGTGLTYQWQIFSGGVFMNFADGGIYTGTGTNKLVLTGATSAYNGSQYRCVVSGACTPSATSAAVTLTVNTAPVITSNPAGTTVCVNGSPSFTVTATGTGLIYQWQENTGSGFVNLTNTPPYSGVTSNTLLINGVDATYNNNQYRVIVTGTCAPPATSLAAVLTVTNNTQWTGIISSAWSNPANWACNTVPSATTNVTIPASAPNMPQVDITTAICDSMTINTGASVAFAGAFNILEIKGSILNSGSFDASQGKVNFSGYGQQLVPGATYYDLQLSQSGDKIVTGGNAIILDSAIFNNGYLAIGDNNLIASPLAALSAGNGTSYILTNGLGKVIQQNVGTGLKSGDILVPVGALRNSYTPLTINNTGTADTFSIWVYSAVYQYYYNDIPTTVTLNSDAVGRSWIVEENTKGGSNVTLTLQWNAKDELSGFDRTNCFMSHFTNKWNAGPKANAVGSGPYSVSMSGISTFSPFGIGSGNSVLPVNNVAKNKEEITVYPNPVTGQQVFVKFASIPSHDVNLRITDVTGRQWSTLHQDVSGIINGVIPVDITTLPTGVYLLQVLDNNNELISVVRFVRQ